MITIYINSNNSVSETLHYTKIIIITMYLPFILIKYNDTQQINTKMTITHLVICHGLNTLDQRPVDPIKIIVPYTGGLV